MGVSFIRVRAVSEMLGCVTLTRSMLCLCAFVNDLFFLTGQNQTKPWLDEFSELILELSNETWNWYAIPSISVHLGVSFIPCLVTEWLRTDPQDLFSLDLWRPDADGRGHRMAVRGWPGLWAVAGVCCGSAACQPLLDPGRGRQGLLYLSSVVLMSHIYFHIDIGCD